MPAPCPATEVVLLLQKVLDLALSADPAMEEEEKEKRSGWEKVQGAEVPGREEAGPGQREAGDERRDLESARLGEGGQAYGLELMWEEAHPHGGLTVKGKSPYGLYSSSPVRAPAGSRAASAAAARPEEGLVEEGEMVAARAAGVEAGHRREELAGSAAWWARARLVLWSSSSAHPLSVSPYISSR